jgi:poly-beta-1,6-N-acetyl-D-glucosamine synthase
MQIFFWISLAIVFYTYLGYGIVLFVMVKIKRLFTGKPVALAVQQLPTATVIVAAFNEEDFIEEKIKNTLSIQYPPHAIQYIFVTDGSADATPNIVQKYPQIRLMHSEERKGKIAAMHRAMETVTTEIVIFTDANTYLNSKAFINIAKHYQIQNVGGVSGEKRVAINEIGDAAASEGLYWKYESTLKSWDSEMYSVMGAAGELFSVRTNLYTPVKANAIIDDFMISMEIVKKGFRIIYEPNAYAVENGSENVSEELKRKIRIAAGGIQSIVWLKSLLLPFKQPLVSFMYISHRVLRWTVTPFFMITCFVLNMVLMKQQNSVFYYLIGIAQLLFYSLAIIGWYFEQRQIQKKAFFVPYYFCMMNYAVIAGLNRYFKGNQSVLWEKAGRRK